MSKRRVLGITAIRSEYFLQRPILRAIVDHPELELLLVVTGAHLSPLHDYTVKEIEADGFPIVARIENLIYSDRDAARLKGAASQLQVLTHLVDELRPEWLLVPADREESMTLALCGTYLNIATAHYAAGDRVVGNADDMIRHAVSRLSHLLLTTHEQARERLIKAGEQSWRIHNVGHAGIDRIRSAPQLTSSELAKALGVDEVQDRYAVVVQHPLTSEIGDAGRQMRETMAAARALKLQLFVSYPNSDPGSNQIIQVIEEHRANPGVHVFRNIPDREFVNLLRGATVLLGNSSLGLLEAPYLKLPVVNVGRRQSERHHASNAFFVAADREAIVRQVRAIIDDEETRRTISTCENPFGDGHTGEQVAKLLASTSIDSTLLNKDLSY
ncbi:MAG TPA: UDP-N-acetylglucosamine 2-epimerase [Pyrinomonadaceae bacterium]|jgi:GDP/UDP-N,N'-diacetylbacillosamine 2-epimerase (hydrolysing)|nr:UDP-N-acetylglucosamine 2-epimerase [Pyrinomonadaceae bacterium]